VLSGELTCQEEPHVTLATALLPLLRLGEDDQARSSHLRGYNLARGNLNITPAIGMHAEFCALTGNEGRGLEIVAENWPMISAVPDPLARLHALTGVAVLLRRLSEAGHGGVPVRSQTADALLAEITPEITSLAARFDARNGSTWLGGIVTGRLEHAPVRGEPLSLAPSAAPPRRHPPCRRAARRRGESYRALVLMAARVLRRV
jgi:hypothetical protein